MRQSKSQEQLGIRLGTTRYGNDSTGGILTEIENKKQNKLSELDVEMNGLILQAQQASKANEFKVLSEKMSTLQSKQDEATKELQSLQKLSLARNQEMEEEKQTLQKQSEIAKLLNNKYTVADVLSLGKYTEDEISAVSETIDRSQQYQKDNAKNAKDLADTALDYGQADIASKITLLDPKSKTFTQDLAKLQAQLKNPFQDLDIQLKKLQIKKAQKDLTDTGEDLDELLTFKEAQEAGVPYGTTKRQLIAKVGGGSIQKENEIANSEQKIINIDTLLKHPGLNSSVGPNALSRIAIADAFGNKQDFIAGVQQITEQLTLDKLIEAKKSGATFGALSDGERITLAAAASKIGSWAIKNKQGKTTGYDISQGAFKKELETIKEFAQRDLKLRGGAITESYLDDVDKSLNIVNDPYSQAGYDLE